ncbi:MAG: sulfatase-like hydrolase/transferase, partial [Anaerolineae bacterium]|nr:sulfatase-like hydrolase/transferase [Anaerolineae bacterium]
DQHYTGEKFSTELFADAAVDFLQSYHSDQPFFLYVAFTAPHDPRTPPPDYTYDPDSLPLPGNFLPQHPFDNGELRVRDEELAAFPRTPAEIRQHIADYYGMISHLDAGVGRILTALAESGHAEDTIVVYTADHGLAVGQHGLMGKQNLYNHSIRIPLILRGPHIPAGQRHDALCYLFDLFPTLCELVDAPLPPSNEGDSLLPLLTGAKATHRASLYHAYQSPVENHDQIQRAVRDTRYKLIEYAINGQHTTQLFDLLEDPLETHNLVDDPRYNDRLQALKHLLGQWQHLVDDPLQ